MVKNYVDVPFEMYYDTKDGIPIEDAIEQLKALNKIIGKQAAIVSSVANASIEKTEIFVNELIEGSWQEKLCIRLFFKSEEDYEKFKNAAGNVEMKDWIKVVLAMGFGAFMFYSIQQMLPKKDEKPQVNIEINNNNGVVSLGKSIELTDEQINKVLEKNSKPNKADKQAALDVMNPAKNGGATKVKIAGYDQLTIPQSDFESLPDEVPNQDGNEREINYSNTDIYIYASDRDKSTVGWAGIVPDLFESRVKFELADEVNPNTLHGQRKVKADIIVHEKYNTAQKEYKPFKVTILKVA
ncbi:hypothetical protein [Acinetobacter baumannii]|uniref:hypothetical protein n=1 Tax=Acinetobacter baumannii TaxID=470 RepID=UPI0013B9DB04|nr:hypothetical protein [Acinetobacter baumannii]NDW71836.1 hypothetical protein [Acinetobacter baumannii]NHO93300.1 hypothetical protein [Acinetobacter baumannii]HCA3168004.1 hypothetical protein [Acinetobacter baumannii]